MQRMQVMALTQRLTAGDQCRVVFQACQLLAGLQQASTQMPFARAPVQPMPGRIRKLQPTGKRLDLLPFTSRYVDVQSMARGCERMGRQFVHSTQRNGHRCQRSERIRGVQKIGMVVGAFCLVQ
ncbi:hypothetical protein D3C84_641510 [compost metagenome]